MRPAVTKPRVQATDTAEPDGRRARRSRNRAAVVDAMFELLEQGETPPSTDSIAERAGVSVSSVFRYFDSLDDLHEQTIEQYFERFAPLFEVPSAGEGDLEQRIDALVTARLRLYEAIAPIARTARSRAPDHRPLAQTLQATRTGFATQVRVQFAAELAPLSIAQASDLVALIDVLTSFEAWDLLRFSHGRSQHLIGRAWRSGIGAMVAPLGTP